MSEIKNSPWLDEQTLHNLVGDFRTVDLFDKQNARRPGELFLSIDRRRRGGKNVYAYFAPSAAFKAVYSKLIQDRPNNAGLELIEWDDRYLVIVRDGVNISNAYYSADKGHVEKLFKMEAGRV